MLKNRLYLAVVSGHFAIDMLNSMGAVLLAVLAVPFGLSNRQIGFALTLYLLVGAVSQPFFGILADRMRGRMMLLAGLSVAWIAIFYVFVSLAPTWQFLLPLFLLAPLGSGLFHPIGTASAAAAHPNQAGSATAVFFFCGQIGLAIGPILAGVLAGLSGVQGIIPLALVALIPAGLLIFASRDEHRLVFRPRRAPGEPSTAQRWTTIAVMLIGAFILLVAFRSSIQATFQSFLPKLFSDRGWDPALFGLLTGVYMGAGAVGNVISGSMADRFGMRVASVGPLLLSVPVGLLCLLAPADWAIFVGAGLAGMLVGGQHSILVVHAQRLLPVRESFAAGLILGFTFASGALGTWASGVLADSIGLQSVMVGVVLMGLPVALLALTLPGRAAPTPAPAPSAD
jgi:FSR family fosmidomycin resistance protein-like MFS transporter